MIILTSIFIIIPLIFSHTFSRFGENFIIDTGVGSFESVKVSIFLFLLVFSTIEFLISDKKFLSKTTILVAVGLLGFVIFETLLFGNQSLFGIGEKQHGSLFFAGLVWFGYLLSRLHKSQAPIVCRAIVATAVLVSIVAITEYLFSYNIFLGFVEDSGRSWGEQRATATLGNPNYVAGYLLMVAPLAHFMRVRWEKYSALALLVFGIISTGSVIGITIMLAYLYLLILRTYSPKNTYTIFIASLTLSLFLLVGILSGTDKWLSLDSRFILMRETFISGFDSISHIMFGRGPNGIIELYEGSRSPIIMSYFPNHMMIDSSHNLLLDILIKFGVLGIGASIYIFRNSWNKLSSEAVALLILGFCFFSLNVAITSTYILFAFAFSGNLKSR